MTKLKISYLFVFVCVLAFFIGRWTYPKEYREVSVVIENRECLEAGGGFEVYSQGRFYGFQCVSPKKVIKQYLLSND